MTLAQSHQGEAPESALVIERIFDAPRELVWRAWTEPELFMRWWGPKDFTSPVSEMDLRVGGKYLSCMRWPDGRDVWNTGVYREIVPPERLAYTASFADERGNVVPATHYSMSAGIALEMLVTVTFEDREGKTKLTVSHGGIPAGEHYDGAQQGWSESFDKLADVLANAAASR